jgi:acetylornithine deacetylase/succinyl-diaminopimelate desuccinylase-like protein
VRDRLGDDIPYEVDWPEQLVAGSSSPAEGPLFDVCQAFLDTADPGTVLLPSLSTGFTDSVYLRAACGTVAYGFSPMLATPPDVALAGFHAKDERVHVDDLLLAVQFHEQAARALLG